MSWLIKIVQQLCRMMKSSQDIKAFLASITATYKDFIVALMYSSADEGTPTMFTFSLFVLFIVFILFRSKYFFFSSSVTVGWFRSLRHDTGYADDSRLTGLFLLLL